MFDKLGQILARNIRIRLDELIFVIVGLHVLAAIPLFGHVLAGRIGLIVGSALGLALYGIGVFAFHRGLVLQRQTPPDSERLDHPVEGEGRRLARGFVILGVLCLGSYGLAFWAGFVQGEGRFTFALFVALAPAFMLVGAAGFFDQRICLAICRDERTRSVPIVPRLTGWLLFLSGLASGGCLAYFVIT